MNARYRWLVATTAAVSLGYLETNFCLGVQGAFVELGKFRSRVPANWAEEIPYDASAYKEYRLEPVNDDKDAARLTIYFLGRGSADSAHKQVESWESMFRPPQGKKLDDVAKVRKLEIGSTAVTYLDIYGDYKGIPGDAAAPPEQNFRLLGVYFPTPQGAYSIRVFGPADTVQFYRQEFEDWVKAFRAPTVSTAVAVPPKNQSDGSAR
jgi:hypothetical protein